MSVRGRSARMFSSSPVQWQRHDLEHMLLGARRLGVPMIVGSAGDTGSNSGVDRFVGIIKDIAREHRLARFPHRLFLFGGRQGTTLRRKKSRRATGSMGSTDGPPLDLGDPRTLPTRVVAPAIRTLFEPPTSAGRRQGGNAGGVIRGVAPRPTPIVASVVLRNPSSRYAVKIVNYRS